MARFSQDIVEEVAARARAHGIAPAAAMAVVEVESAGNPFEADGRTPRFLFEKHIFHRELRRLAPGLLATAVAQGLAVPSWQGKAQYADQGKGARMALLARARQVDVDIANRSASWGLGQILGLHAERLGYASASDMVERMSAGGVPEQLEAMLRFIVADANLMRALLRRDWARFALGYNGKQYAVNDYDSKLASAYRAWSARFNDGLSTDDSAAPAVTRSAEEITDLQQKLARLGYPVGKIDGLFGPITEAALFAFQRRNGLEASGQPDDATVLALPSGEAMPVGARRQDATEQELRRDGIPGVVAAVSNRRVAAGVGVLGLAGAASAFTDLGGIAGRFFANLTQLGADGASSSGLDGLVGAALPLLGVGGAVPAAAVAAGLFLLRNLTTISTARVQDHREGFERNSPSRIERTL